MAQTPNGTSDPKRISHFCDIVEHCLCECADTRCGPHDVFLWNARRLAEAILYALAEGTDILKNGKNPAPELKDLPRRLVQDGHLHPQLVPYFDVLRSCGNVGAHAQGPETLADETTLDSCKTAIVHVVEWFYRKSKLAKAMSEAVKAHIAELESDQPKPSRSDRHAQQLRDLEAERNQERGKAAYLQSRLAEVTSALTTRPNATPTVTEVVAMAQSGRSLARKLLLVALGMVLGGAVAVAVVHFGPSNVAMPAAKVALAPPACPPPKGCPAAETCPAAAPCPACEVAVPAAATGAAEPAEAAAAVPVDAPVADDPLVIAEKAQADKKSREAPTCMSGTVLVTAGRLEIRKAPWPRPQTWGKKLQRPAPQDVAAFCLADRPIPTLDYLTKLPSRSCRPAKGNATQKGAGQLPINLVTWACARDYCERLGGSLPTVAQWEFAVHSGAKVGLAKNTGEFTHDSQPFTVLGFGGTEDINKHVYFARRIKPRPRDGSPWLSWHLTDTAADGLKNISFRCAWPVKAAEGTP